MTDSKARKATLPTKDTWLAVARQQLDGFDYAIDDAGKIYGRAGRDLGATLYFARGRLRVRIEITSRDLWSSADMSIFVQEFWCAERIRK